MARRTFNSIESTADQAEALVQQGRWVLLDYVDMVVHIFHPTLREFYQLERLWSDAAVVAVDQQQGVLK